MKIEPDAYIITLRPLKWHTPPFQRLRILLKVALRCFGLKAERIQASRLRP